METKNTAWDNFDSWAEKMARGEVDFDRFLRETKSEFMRLARRVARMKKLPSWWTIDDVFNGLVTAAWHNFFVRAGGFKVGMYRSPGAWIRWKAQNRVRKDISKAKGENQHRRLGPGVPEYLSKTGELPEQSSEANVAVECSIELRKLEKICKVTKDFVILRAIADAFGDREAVVEILAGTSASPEEKKSARRDLDAFQKRMVKSRKPEYYVS